MHIDHGNGAVFQIGHEGEATIIAKCNLVLSSAGGDAGGRRQRFRIEHCDSGDFVGVCLVSHPQVLPVGLEGHPAGRRSHVEVGRDLPGFHVDYGDPPRCRHRDEQPLTVRAQHPVFAGAFQPDHGQELGPAEAEQGIHDGNRGVVIQRQNVVHIEIEFWLREQAAAGELLDFRFTARSILLDPVNQVVQPCRGIQTGER